MTSKAQVAGEVAAAAPLAASLPAAGTAAQTALPVPTPSALRAALEGSDTSPASQGKASKVQKELTDPPTGSGMGSKRQIDAGQRAAEGKAQLEDVAKLANELQPTGSTLSTMQVHTKVLLDATCKRVLPSVRACCHSPESLR